MEQGVKQRVGMKGHSLQALNTRLHDPGTIVQYEELERNISVRERVLGHFGFLRVSMFS